MIKAQLFDFRPVGHETMTPFSKGLGIGVAEVLHLFQHHSRLGEMPLQHLV